MATGTQSNGVQHETTEGGARLSLAQELERHLFVAALSLVLLQALVSFTAAASIAHVGVYDPAWYYSVARNIARGDLPPDHVIWHYLGIPESVERWPGDYWSPGWPWLLGGLMALAGSSMSHAVWICAVVSLALPPLVFFTLRALTGQALLAWLGGLVVILQVPLQQLSVTPVPTLLYQIAVLAGFTLLMRALSCPDRRARLLAAGAVLAAPVWLRGDGFLPLAAALLTVLVAAGGMRAARRLVAGGWILAGSMIALVPLWLHNALLLGSATPAPRRMVPFLITYDDLAAFLSDPSAASWWALGPAVHLERIAGRLAEVAGELPSKQPLLLIPLALAGAFHTWLARGRHPAGLFLTLLAILRLVAPVVLAPMVSIPSKQVIIALPLLCLLALLGLAWIVELARPAGRAGIAAALAVALVGLTVWVWPARIRNPLDRSWAENRLTLPAYFDESAVPRFQRGDLLLAKNPWIASAVANVATMMPPSDGAEAVIQAVERFRPTHLLLEGEERGMEEEFVTHLHVRLEVLSERPEGTWYRITYGPQP